MLYVEAGQAFEKTDSFFKIMAQLPRPWCWLRVLRFCPRVVRDGCMIGLPVIAIGCLGSINSV